MATKVKYPIRAALARFFPIDNHLDNMQEYLAQADEQGVFAERTVHFLCGKLAEIRNLLAEVEETIKPFREKSR